MKETKVKRGLSAKDSKYLRRITNAVGSKEHPFNSGVQMQAHHVLSAYAVELTGRGDDMEVLGYDINLLPNLAFIPCTLQGACYLGIQPHRGNHTAAVVSQTDYDDDGEDKNDYHAEVAERILGKLRKITKKCTGEEIKDSKMAIKKLNKLSAELLKLIQMNPQELPLTSIAKHFGKSKIGCGGQKSVTLHSGRTQCPMKRDHFHDDTREQTETFVVGVQDFECITWPRGKGWTLRFEEDGDEQ